jgi:hypothetical protein
LLLLLVLKNRSVLAEGEDADPASFGRGLAASRDIEAAVVGGETESVAAIERTSGVLRRGNDGDALGVFQVGSGGEHIVDIKVGGCKEGIVNTVSRPI